MKQLNEIQQRLKSPKGNVNQFGKYRYRKAEDILAAVKPLLGGCTVTLSDEVVLVPCEEDRVVKVKTQQPNPATGKMMEVMEDRVIHTGGRFFLKATASISDGTETVTATGWAEIDSHAGMSKEQCLGASSSYSRKYALCGLFGIDDSANDPDVIDNRPRPTQANPTAAIAGCATIEQLAQLWEANPDWQYNQQIKAAFTAKKQAILQQNK
jgi:hypothetical protein